MVWSKQEHPSIIQEHPSYGFGEISKELGVIWGKLSDAEKTKFQE